MSKDRFAKYGQHFENEDPGSATEREPESPYESRSYVPPEKREPSALEKEQAELAELRGGTKNHWDS